MKTSPKRKALVTKAGNRGVALVISLGFIVLLTILVTSYLVTMRLDRLSTHNYSQAARSKELAQGAMVEILESIQQEITDGSQVTEYSDDVTVYVPNTLADILPKRVGFEDQDYTLDISVEPGKLPISLLQVSRSGEQASVSDVSTNTPSINGRVMSAQRWNKPMLLGVDAPDVFANNPPDWVYVTRSGSGVDTSLDLNNFAVSGDLDDEQQILGRYAYVVYEQGGLLDMNVAGHIMPPTDEDELATFNTALRGKSALAFADLSALPGFSGMTQAARESFMDDFVTWRQKGSISKAADGLGAGQLAFLESVRDLQQDGFLEMQSGDSPLIGRQDILNYFEQKKLPEQALPFLTHFSRAVAKPSWGPEKNSSEYDTFVAASAAITPIDYADEAADQTSINPRFATLLFTDEHDIVHYRDDGTIEPKSEAEKEISYSVKEGDAAVQRRFSLAKLAWIGHEGPNEDAFDDSLSKTDMDKAIYSCFGLEWNAGADFPRWEYKRNGGNEILTLDEVQKEGREPDFFELLKGTILNGSLGRDPGPGSPTVRHGNDRQYVGGLRFNQIYPQRDMQILQIGANIIDQADRDRFPTAIYSGIPLKDFTSPDIFSAESREYFATVTGIENIPYIARIWNPAATVNGRGGTVVRSWWQPEMWSPHRYPEDATAPSPSAYRIRAFGVSQLAWNTNPQDTLYDSLEYLFSEEVVHEDSPNNYVAFTDNGRFYKSPSRLVVGDNFSGGSTPVMNQWNSGYKWNQSQFLGIFAGEIVRPESVEDTIVRVANGDESFFQPRTTVPLGDPPPTLVTEYRGADGTWRPAGIFARFNSNRRNTTRAFQNGALKSEFEAGVIRSSNSRFDIRTDRFSCMHMEDDDWDYNISQNHSDTLWDSKGTRNSRFYLPYPNTGIYFFSDLSQPTNNKTTAIIPAMAQNVRFEPKDYAGKISTGESTFYTDPDGVVRPGDAWRVNLSTSDGDTLIFDEGLSAPPSASESRQPSRNVILDRPFQSVGELGMVFRDSPFRNLDFWTEYSADAGLLDVFAVRDEPRVSAGKVNVNMASLPVLEALLKGAGKHAADAGIPALNDEEAKAVATAILAEANTAPLQNSAEYVTRLAPAIATALEGTTTDGDALKANKTMAEAPVRALTPVDNMRTWNLLIDVVAQSGRLPQSASGLDQFVVEGETRYWVHVAIDRYTNEIVDYQVETVYE